jgi:hypothetical protein
LGPFCCCCCCCCCAAVICGCCCCCCCMPPEAAGMAPAAPARGRPGGLSTSSKKTSTSDFCVCRGEYSRERGEEASKMSVQPMRRDVRGVEGRG